MVGDLIAVGEFSAFDRLAGEGEKQRLLGRLGVGGVALLVAGHVGELVEREFAGQHAGGGLPRDVEDVVVVVVGCPRALVGVCSNVDIDGPREAVFGFEEIRCAQKRVGGNSALDANVHV